ncbi:hypothetical protein [Enterococcus sp. DIV1420a]|uniref:hypothetical protein n=1 Tax=Enterococcus sp. DIV1420a TaxID=2774672 RepID=UPI003F2206E5
METKTYKPIDDLIKKTGFRISYFADKMGITPSTLWKLRVEPDKMSVKQMELFGEIVGVDFFVIYKLTKKFAQEVDLNATYSDESNIRMKYD